MDSSLKFQLKYSRFNLEKRLTSSLIAIESSTFRDFHLCSKAHNSYENEQMDSDK